MSQDNPTKNQITSRNAELLVTGDTLASAESVAQLSYAQLLEQIKEDTFYCPRNIQELRWLLSDITIPLQQISLREVCSLRGAFANLNLFTPAQLRQILPNLDPRLPLVKEIKRDYRELRNWNTTGVTDLSFCFAGCLGLNHDLNGWDTSEVTDVSFCFLGCQEFNHPLNWNLAQVQRFTGMFFDCFKFAQRLVVDMGSVNWQGEDVSPVRYMLGNCHVLLHACFLSLRNAPAFVTPEVLFSKLHDTTYSAEFLNMIRVEDKLVPQTIAQLRYLLRCQQIDWDTVDLTGIRDWRGAFADFTQLETWLSTADLPAETRQELAAWIHEVRDAQGLSWYGGDDVPLPQGAWEQFLLQVAPKLEDASGLLAGRVDWNVQFSLYAWKKLRITNWMLAGCTSWNQLFGFNNELQSIRGMFCGCVAFNQPIDIFASYLRDVSHAWAGCVNFNQNLTITSYVLTYIDYFLAGCAQFNSLLNIGNANLKTMRGAFMGCARIQQPLRWSVQFNTTAEDCKDCFQGTPYLDEFGALVQIKSLPLAIVPRVNSQPVDGYSRWSEPLSLGDVFRPRTKPRVAHQKQSQSQWWQEVPQATEKPAVEYKLKSKYSFYEVKSVKELRYLLQQGITFKQIDLKGVPSLEYALACFRDPATESDSELAAGYALYWKQRSVCEQNWTAYDYSIPVVYELELTDEQIQGMLIPLNLISKLKFMFAGQRKLQNLKFELSAYSLKDTSYMFLNCTSLISVPLRGNPVRVYSLEQAAGMFANCRKWNRSLHLCSNLLTDTTAMFAGCRELQQRIIVQASELRNYHDMFKGCSKLRLAPWGKFSTLENRNKVFAGCKKLGDEEIKQALTMLRKVEKDQTSYTRRHYTSYVGYGSYYWSRKPLTKNQPQTQSKSQAKVKTQAQAQTAKKKQKATAQATQAKANNSANAGKKSVPASKSTTQPKQQQATSKAKQGAANQAKKATKQQKTPAAAQPQTNTTKQQQKVSK